MMKNVIHQTIMNKYLRLLIIGGIILIVIVVIVGPVLTTFIDSNPINTTNEPTSTININETNGQMSCKIIKGGLDYSYPPSLSNFKFGVNFNTTIMQSNYVYYVSTGGGNSVSGNWKTDPYDLDVLSSSDYTNTGYDRGHLVPNADYGHDTFYMVNAVPMLPNFNRGSWKRSEEYIRDNYAGKLVYKGCDYNGVFIESNKDNDMYIPSGCYYIVFNSHSIEEIEAALVLLEFGYIQNIENAEIESKLPWWIQC